MSIGDKIKKRYSLCSFNPVGCSVSVPVPADDRKCNEKRCGDHKILYPDSKQPYQGELGSRIQLL